MQFFYKYSYKKITLIIILTLLTFSATSFAKYRHHSDKVLRQQTAKNIAKDDLEGEDLKIRRVAVKALGTAAGAIVVMDAQTGRILTIVNQNWAIRQAFKPCSVIKLVTSVAGYNENLIRSNGNLKRGTYRLGLDDALAYSNNSFFQKVGTNLGSRKVVAYARRLGLGERTGINAENETTGRLPYGNENLRIYSHADDYRTSPLQLAVMVSALTNGGKLVIPKIPRTRIEKTSFRGFWKRQIGISPTVFERVIPGMVGAVNYGTARRMTKSGMNIAGKTGSCIADKTWVGSFASVAPIQNPRYSVVVITKGKNARGKYSAAIAGKIYQALKPRLHQRFNGTVARKTIVVKSSPRVIVTGSSKKKETQNIKIKDDDVAKNNKPAKRSKSIKSNKKSKKPKELFPTIIIKGKTEIVRPRVVQR